MPEVMIPLDGPRERAQARAAGVGEVAKQVMLEKGAKVKYKFGTMIEIPRAAVTADEIASVATFFSYGTNDLTR